MVPPKLIRPDGTEMVLVPEGVFVMGTDNQERYEGPAHEVGTPAFYIDVHHVTVARYRHFLRTTSYTPCSAAKTAVAELDDLPVTDLTWEDAKAYTTWAGASLPTEVQWEKAARGTDGRTFPWGNRWSPENCCCTAGGATQLAPVGSFPADCSPYGCYDMAGNASEWLLNWATLEDYKRLPEGNPGDVDYANRRSVRGGNWFCTDPSEFACATRGVQNPDCGHRLTSFRCVLDIESARRADLI